MKNLARLGEKVGVYLESGGEPQESFDQSSIR